MISANQPSRQARQPPAGGGGPSVDSAGRTSKRQAMVSGTRMESLARSRCKTSISTTNKLALIIVIINCLFLADHVSSGWRLFGSHEPSRLSGAGGGLGEPTFEPTTSGRSFNDHYQPFYNSLYGPPPAAPPNANQHQPYQHHHQHHQQQHYQTIQLLTPSTANAQHQQANSQQVSSYLNDQVIPAGGQSEASSVQQQSQFASPSSPSPPPPQAAALSAAPQVPDIQTVAKAAGPEEPQTGVASSSEPVKGRDASPDTSRQLEPATTAPASTSFSTSTSLASNHLSGPSPLGKIIDSMVSSALNESLSSRSQSAASAAAAASTSTSTGEQQSNTTQQSQQTGGRLLGNVALHILKPRNKSSSSSSAEKKGNVASAEQQIINQHARVHLSGHSHQRLLPTKHRDNKVVGLLSDSSSTPTSSLSSPSSSSSSSSFSSPAASLAEPLYSLLLSQFKSGITSRSSIKKAISDNKLARTLSTVTKTIGGNKYVAGAGAAAALAALGLTMSKLLSPYLFAGTYSKLGEPMTMSSSFLYPSRLHLNPYLGTDRNYQSPSLLLSSSQAGLEPLMSSSSSLAAAAAAAAEAAAAAAAQNHANDLVVQQGSQLLEAYQQQQHQSANNNQQEQIDSSSSLASDHNGHYTGYYSNAPAENAPNWPPPSNSPSFNKQITNNNNNNNNNNDQMIMSGTSSVDSLGYLASQQQLQPPAVAYSALPSFEPRRSAGTVLLKMDDSARNLLHQMISQQQQQSAQVSPQVTNYLQPQWQPQRPPSDHSTPTTGWMANAVELSSPPVNGHQSSYYSTSGEDNLLIEPRRQRQQQPNKDQQRQINQGGQQQVSSLTSSSSSSSSRQLNFNSNDKKQRLTPARQHPQRVAGGLGSARFESQGWQSIGGERRQQQQQQQPTVESWSASNGSYQVAHLRQSKNNTGLVAGERPMNANDRAQRDVAGQWQQMAASRPTPAASHKPKVKQTRRPTGSPRQPSSSSSSSSAPPPPSATSSHQQVIDYGLATGSPDEDNRQQQQQQSGVPFDLQQPPEASTATSATAIQLSDNNGRASIHHHHQQQNHLLRPDDAKQNAIKIIEMNGNISDATAQLVADPIEAVVLSPSSSSSSSTSSPNNNYYNNEDINSTSSSYLSLGDVGDNNDNYQPQPQSDHLRRDAGQSVVEPPTSRASRGPVAGSIVGHLTAAGEAH